MSSEWAWTASNTLPLCGVPSAARSKKTSRGVSCARDSRSWACTTAAPPSVAVRKSRRFRKRLRCTMVGLLGTWVRNSGTGLSNLGNSASKACGRNFASEHTRGSLARPAYFHDEIVLLPRGDRELAVRRIKVPETTVDDGLALPRFYHDRRLASPLQDPRAVR